MVSGRQPGSVLFDNSKKLIILNGPPKSGKDFMGEILEKSWDNRAGQYKFAKALKDACHSLVGLHNVDHTYFEEQKDKEVNDFFGMTPRKVYIEMSENFVKKVWGNLFFGNVLARQIVRDARYKDIFILTDSGFIDEVRPVAAMFREDCIILIRTHRDGTSFIKDSRSYIAFSNPGIAQVDLTNPGPTIKTEILHRLLMETIEEHLGKI